MICINALIIIINIEKNVQYPKKINNIGIKWKWVINIKKAHNSVINKANHNWLDKEL